MEVLRRVSAVVGMTWKVNVRLAPAATGPSERTKTCWPPLRFPTVPPRERMSATDAAVSGAEVGRPSVRFTSAAAPVPTLATTIV